MLCHPLTLSVFSWSQVLDNFLPSGRQLPSQPEAATDCEGNLPGQESSRIKGVADNTLEVGQYTMDPVMPNSSRRRICGDPIPGRLTLRCELRPR